MEGYTPVYEALLRGETPPHTDDSGYLTNTPSSAGSLDSVPSGNRKLLQGCKCRYRNCSASAPGTEPSHTPGVHCYGAHLSVFKKRKVSLAKLKILHTPDSLSSSTEVEHLPSADSKLPSQSKDELLRCNDFEELSPVENSSYSEENGKTDNSTILYDELEVRGNKSVWEADNKEDNRDNTRQKSIRKPHTEYHHVTDIAIPYSGCSQDSGIVSQDVANPYCSQKRDLSVDDYDLITNKLKMLARKDASQDPRTKCQILEETTRHPVPVFRSYSRLKLPCQTGREQIDFFYLLGERSDHHTVVRVILSYLEPKDLTAVVQVSKTWNRVCKSDRDARGRICRYLEQKRDKENATLQVCRQHLA
jgi:hypothetical protein